MKFEQYLEEQKNNAKYLVGDFAYVYHLTDEDTIGDFYKKFRVSKIDSFGFHVQSDDVKQEDLYFRSSTLKSVDVKNKQNSNKFIVGDKP